jgi:glycosyltransferase involved in cell wall biosynthesis
MTFNFEKKNREKNKFKKKCKNFSKNNIWKRKKFFQKKKKKSSGSHVKLWIFTNFYHDWMLKCDLWKSLKRYDKTKSSCGLDSWGFTRLNIVFVVTNIT